MPTIESSAARGPKRRAKTDRTDARLARELLAGGRLPESWVPPWQVREVRVRLGLYKDLRDEHTAWVQHPRHPVPPGRPGDRQRRAGLAGGAGAAGRRRGPVRGRHQAVRAALRILDALEAELDALHRELAAFARRQRGCQALAAQYGVGAITSTAIWAMMGDPHHVTGPATTDPRTEVRQGARAHTRRGNHPATRPHQDGPP